LKSKEAINLKSFTQVRQVITLNMRPFCGRVGMMALMVMILQRQILLVCGALGTRGNFSGRNSRPDFSGGDVFGHHGSGTDHRVVTDGDPFQDNDVAAQPHIISDPDLSLDSGAFANQFTLKAMVVVNKPASGSYRTVVANPDSLGNVKFASPPNEHVITNNDGGAGPPDAPVKLEVNVRLQTAP
jgi:hypothetical protein